MHKNNTVFWTISSSVWNAGMGFLKELISGGLSNTGPTSYTKSLKYYNKPTNSHNYLKRLFIRRGSLVFLVLVFCLTALISEASAITSEKQASLTSITSVPFNTAEIIEKAEHLVRKDQSNPNLYWVEEPEYRVEFTADSMTYYQKHEGKVIEDNALRFILEAISVSGNSVLSPLSNHSVKMEENRFTYQRTSTIKEIYESGRDGVEQSWIIEKPLSANPADVVIQGKLITPLSYKTNNNGGIDLFNKNKEYVTTYGKVTVIDNAGKKITLSPEYNGSLLAITIPSKWLAGAEYPVLVDPLIGSNVRVDSLTTTDNYPAIAFDGINYLIVWQSGTPNAQGTGTTAISGARVSSSGTLLDGTPLSIGNQVDTGCTSTCDDEFPSVAYDSLNSRYIVVWMQWDDTSGAVTSSNIWRNTVTIWDGVPADDVGTATKILDGGTRIFAYPVVACCDVNNNYYVVYGRPNTQGSTSFNAFRGQAYNRNTHTATTASNPTATVSSGTITPNIEPRSAPRLYSLSTTKYMLTWETFGVDTNGDISANLVTVTTTPSYTWGTQVTVANTPASTLHRYPRAAYDGTNAFIVYQQGATTSADIYGMFVTPGATNLTPGTTYAISTVAGSGQTYPDAAYTAGTCSANPINRYMVVWQDYRNNATNPDIYGSSLTTTGTVETAIAISTDTTYIKQLPVIAADTGSCGYLVAWSDYRNNGTTLSDIYAQRVGYPNINNLDVASQYTGNDVTINGMNFGADPGSGNRSTTTNNVTLTGPTTVTIPDDHILSWSDLAILFKIPLGTSPGTYAVTVTAGSWTSNGSNLTVSDNILQITTPSLPNGFQWISYGSNVSATGGTPGYTWAIISGSLPGGVALDPGTGLISGTPNNFGTFNFTVQVTDSSTPTPQTATQALSILVYELVTIAVTPANPTITQSQTQQFTATGTYNDPGSSTSDITSIVTWGSSNPAVATVDSMGLATGAGLGSVTISAIK